jgi:hypothetical protein
MEKGWVVANEWIFTIYVNRKTNPVGVRVMPGNMTRAHKAFGNALASLITLWYRMKEEF